ncbi:hypothetical protein Hte_003739 [Hypoxylon texense]
MDAIQDEQTSAETAGLGPQSQDPSQPEADKRKCTYCLDTVDVDRIVTLACGHEMERRCLRIFFQSATLAGTPARCCDAELPLQLAEGLLDAEQLRDYRLVLYEQTVEDRTYCHARGCSCFLLPETYAGSGEATCPNCGAATCTACKGPAHDGDCPRDEALEQALAQGYKQCPRCRVVVEHYDGCYYVTCPNCGEAFCFLCLKRWKTCDCRRFPGEEEETDRGDHMDVDDDANDGEEEEEELGELGYDDYDMGTDDDTEHEGDDEDDDEVNAC